MKKNRKEAEEPTSGPGWATFQEVSEDFEPDNWDELEKDSFYKAPKMIRFRWHMMEKLANYWFKKLAKGFARSVYDIGSGDFGLFVQTQRFTPRAQYLLKNKWVNVQFGFYLIEYTIVDGVAYSHFSLNYGIRYVFFMESKLTKNQESNVKIITDLFTETEESLHQTFANRKPPYTPNYLFR
jgi:hypothetical protein